MDFENAPPASLAELIDLDTAPQRVWHTGELGDVLAHELSVPLRNELGPLDGDGPAGFGGMTVGQLLHQHRPPLDLLKRLKRFAKAARRDHNSHLPEDVAAVLYALAIGAALLRGGHHITTMSATELRSYFDWALGRPWLDAGSRQLIGSARRALEAVDAAGGGASSPA